MLEIYYFFYIMCNMLFMILMYFYLSFYYRLMFISLVIFKRNTNTVMYLTNEIYHYTLTTDTLIIKNFEMPLLYIINALQIIKFCYGYIDYLLYVVEGAFNNVYHLLHKNHKISLYIENTEKNMEEYNIMYLQKRDEFINSIFKNMMSSMVELVKNNNLHQSNQKSFQTNQKNDKYKNNIKGTIHKLKKKKKIS